MTDLPTPLPPPPRQVRPAAGGAAGCGRVFILPHVLVGLCLLGVVGLRLGTEAFGRRVTAVVDARSTSHGTKGGTTYHLRFHYTLDGRRRDDGQSVSADEYRRRRGGDRVAGRAVVLFDRAFCLVDVGGAARQTWIAVGLAAIWNGLVGLFVYALWVAPRRLRRLLETGTAVAGEVTDARLVRRRTGNTVYLRYQFHTAGGPAQGRQTVTGKGVRGFDARKPVTVVYDPARPARNAAWEASGYELRPMAG